jgi:hypothetical protein
MPTIDERHYLERRAAQERTAAEQAACAMTRGLHLDLASRYAEQAAAIEQQAGGGVTPASA